MFHKSLYLASVAAMALHRINIVHDSRVDDVVLYLTS